MSFDNQYPRAVHVVAWGRNKIGKTDPGALEGHGETGVLTSAKTLELPITKPLPEIDQVIKIDGDLALVIGVRQIDEKRVELVFRPMPGATRQLEQSKKSGGPG